MHISSSTKNTCIVLSRDMGRSFVFLDLGGATTRHKNLESLCANNNKLYIDQLARRMLVFKWNDDKERLLEEL